jgi:hypothetical protein
MGKGYNSKYTIPVKLLDELDAVIFFFVFADPNENTQNIPK